MVDFTTPKEVVFYQDEKGIEPFTIWLNSLKDTQGRRRILTRIRRLEQGNFGDCKPVGGGLSELRLFFGPGYRVYFGEEAENTVIILIGGDKSSQRNDIKVAKNYWKEYLGHDKT